MWVIKTVTKEEYEICDSASNRIITGSSGGFVKDTDGRLVCIRHIVSMRKGTLSNQKTEQSTTDDRKATTHETVLVHAAVITDNKNEEESPLEHEIVPEIDITVDSGDDTKQTLIANKIIPEPLKAPRGRPPKKK